MVDPDLDRRFHHDSVVVMFVYPTDIRRATLGPKRCLPRLRHAALHRVPGEPVFGLLTLYDVVLRKSSARREVARRARRDRPASSAREPF